MYQNTSTYLNYLDDRHTIYSCGNCRTNLIYQDDIISKGFQGQVQYHTVEKKVSLSSELEHLTPLSDRASVSSGASQQCQARCQGEENVVDRDPYHC